MKRRGLFLLFFLPLAAVCLQPVPAPAAVDPALILDDGAIGAVGGVASAGILAEDTNGDGVPEIVAGCSDYWYMLAWDSRNGRYVQTCFHEIDPTSRSYNARFQEFAIGDVDGDGARELVILIGDAAAVSVYDLAGCRFEGTQDLGIADPTSMALADLEGGPAAEIVILNEDGLSVFRFGFAGPLWSTLGLGGQDVAVGNIDADPALEIVVATDYASPGLVVDTTTHRAEYAYLAGFGAGIAAADVDADGMDEVVCCCYDIDDYYVRVVDADTRTTKWQMLVSDGSPFIMRDLTGDGAADVLVGGSYHVFGFEGVTGAPLFDVSSLRGSVRGFDAGDLDGDCELEIASSSSYDGDLTVTDVRNQAQEWSSFFVSGPMYAFAVVDVDADGRTDVLRAVHGSRGYDDGTLLFITDFHHRIDRYAPTDFVITDTDEIVSVAVAQLDADPALEYVLPEEAGSGWRLTAHDGITHEKMWWSVSLDGYGSPVGPLAAGDLDSDGLTEVVAGTRNYLWVLQGSDGAPIWRSPAGVTPTDIRIADLDSDGTTELAFAAVYDGFYVFDGRTFVEEWHDATVQALSLDIGDVDGDLDLDLVVGDDSGGLSAFDGATRTLLFNESVGPSEAIRGVRMSDLDGDSENEVLIAHETPGSYTASIVTVLRGSDRSLIWQSPPLLGYGGYSGSLEVADADDDGLPEIAVAGSRSIRFFEYAGGRSDTEPPVWESGAGVQSAVPSSCCPVVELAWAQASDASSPPIAYNAYRDTIPGFTPGPATLVARTRLTSLRDRLVAPGTRYFYVVRAEDAQGHEDSNTVELSATAMGVVRPVPPVIDAATDPDDCVPGGIRIEFSYSGDPSAIRFDLLSDGVAVLSDVTSPVDYDPLGPMSHEYRIEAVHSTCAFAATSAPVDVTDTGSYLAGPTITSARDDEPCLTGGIEITFTHHGFNTSGHYALVSDGVIVAEPVTSPVVYTAVDTVPHDYVIRAVEEGCPRIADSQPASVTDENGIPAKPLLSGIVDEDACLAGRARLDFSHPGFRWAGHYELWRDGGVFVSSVVPKGTVDPGDGLAHAYTIRAVEEACDVFTDSDPAPFQDNETCGLGEPVVYAVKTGPDDLRLEWDPAPGADVASYNVYVGTLAGLRPGASYDHAKSRPGVTFPDSPTPSDGCDAAAGPGTTARVLGLDAEDVYLLVVAADSRGREGPYGKAGSGLDRRNPAVDPRPPSYFCP